VITGPGPDVFVPVTMIMLVPPVWRLHAVMVEVERA
jgi:hypothetical protein